MEFIIIAIVIIINIIILKKIFNYNKKEIEHIADNKELDELADKYPENIEMAKEYLEMLKNEKVIIEENKDTESSLYIAISDKISIANIRKSYTRIQTIAHECLHSIQDRKLLLFNFAFSNIYLLYFVIVCILAIFKLLPYKMMFLTILLILGMIYNMVRIFLENDAMIKARYLAEDYMQNKKISSEKEIEKIVSEFDKINSVGVKCTNFYLFLTTMIQVLVFTIICILT